MELKMENVSQESLTKLWSRILDENAFTLKYSSEVFGGKAYGQIG